MGHWRSTSVMPSGDPVSPYRPALPGPIWFGCLALLVILLAWLGALTIRNVVTAWPKFPSDFLVFWTAARAPLHSIYDVEALTRAQAWAVVDLQDKRPFAYPPTFLLLIAPFGRLPLLAAVLAWSAIGIGLFCAASRQLIGRAWPLMLLSPAFVCAAVTGQVTFMIGAGLMAGVLLLPRRSLLAGLLFGVVATLKPQAAVMVPLALIVGQHWRALLAATLSGGAIGAASLAWRPELWSQWLKALPTFSRIIESDAWDMWIGVTPKATAHQLGLQGTPFEPVLIVAAGAMAVATVVMAFRRGDPLQRYAALCVGYLLISPYALWYELALLQPVAVALLLARGWPPRAAGLVAYTLFGRILSTLAVGAMILFPTRRPQAGFSVPVRP
jgi:hypothetical protein